MRTREQSWRRDRSGLSCCLRDCVWERRDVDWAVVLDPVGAVVGLPVGLEPATGGEGELVEPEAGLLTGPLVHGSLVVGWRLGDDVGDGLGVGVGHVPLLVMRNSGPASRARPARQGQAPRAAHAAKVTVTAVRAAPRAAASRTDSHCR